eukprot:663230-Rhodomonas_salina.1
MVACSAAEAGLGGDRQPEHGGGEGTWQLGESTGAFAQATLSMSSGENWSRQPGVTGVVLAT